MACGPCTADNLHQWGYVTGQGKSFKSSRGFAKMNPNKNYQPTQSKNLQQIFRVELIFKISENATPMFDLVLKTYIKV